MARIRDGDSIEGTAGARNGQGRVRHVDGFVANISCFSVTFSHWLWPHVTSVTPDL